MLRRRSRKTKQKKRHGSKKSFQTQVKKTYFAKKFWEEKNKKERKKKYKGTLLSLEDPQTRNTVFSRPKKDSTKGTIKKYCFFCEEGRVCKWRKIEKVRKTMIKPNRVFKKKERYINRDQQRTTFKNENKEEKQIKTRE